MNMNKVRKQDKVNILSLPPELLTEIFEFAVKDVRDIVSINKVCRKFNKAAQAAILYKDVKIVDEASFNDAIKVITEHAKFVKNIVIKWVEGWKVTAILRTVYENVELASLKIKYVKISNVAIHALSVIVADNQELRSLKISYYEPYLADKEELINLNLVDVDFNLFPVNTAWEKIFQTISSRSMVEFRFIPDNSIFNFFHTWDFDAFLQTSKNTIKSLKTTKLNYDMKNFNGCSKLKKLRLLVTPHRHNNDWLLPSNPLKQLTSLDLILKFPDDAKSAFLFLSQQRHVNLRKICITGYYCFRDYCKILKAIGTNCPNLEDLFILIRREFRIYRPISKTILELLTACKALKKVILPPMLIQDSLLVDQLLSTGNYGPFQRFEIAIAILGRIETFGLENRFIRRELIYQNFTRSGLLISRNIVCQKMKLKTQIQDDKEKYFK